MLSKTLVVIGGISSFGVTRHEESRAMSQTPELFPAVPFENETIVRNDSSFVDACKAKVADAAEKFGWRFETSVLTRSEKWGLVWRADFRIKNQSAERKLINRVICWREPGATEIRLAVTFGQQIEPL